MPLNTDLPDYLARQLPDQQSNAQLNQQVSANLLHGMRNKQNQRELAQRDRQIDLQERDQAMQESLFPLKQRSEQLKLEELSATVATSLSEAKGKNLALSRLGRLSQIAVDISTDPKGFLKPENRAKLWQLAVDAPQLASMAQFQNLDKLFDVAADNENNRQRFLKDAGTTDIKNAQAITDLRLKADEIELDDPSEAQRLRQQADLIAKPTSSSTGVDPEFIRLQRLRDQATSEGRTKDASEIQTHIEKLNSIPGASKVRRTIMPDGSVTEEPITGRSDLMPSTRAQFQQKMTALQNLQGVVKDLSQNLRPGAVGPVAAAREAVSQYTGNIPGLNIADMVVGIGGKDFEQRQKLKELRAIAFRAFSDQTGQVSNRDQEMIDDLLPPTGFKGNVRLARQSLESLAENSARRALSYGSDLGQVPDWALQNADARDLTQMVGDKILKLEILTPEQLKTLVGRNQGFLPLAREELKRRQVQP